MGNNHKKPSALSLPPSAKKPRAELTPDQLKGLSPSWQFGSADMAGQWGWQSLPRESFDLILARLKSYESQTWAEIIGDRNNSCGPMATESICAEAKARLEAIRQADTDSLFKLRVTQKGRVWGIKEGPVLKILWWDPEHTVYPVEMRNT